MPKANIPEGARGHFRDPFYTILVKIELPRVLVLSEKDSSSMPMERMMLR